MRRHDDEFVERRRNAVHHRFERVAPGVMTPRGHGGERDAPAELDTGPGGELEPFELEDLGAGSSIRFDEMDAVIDDERLAMQSRAGDAELEAQRVTDLATLRARGLPITGETGRGGGIRLEGDRGITALHLSITEVAAIWLAARLSRETSDLPWGEAARSALAKLLASLPRAKARQLRALCRRVVIGPAASARVRASAGVAPRELLGLFDTAFSQWVGLGFQYTDRAGGASGASNLTDCSSKARFGTCSPAISTSSSHAPSEWIASSSPIY